MYTIVFFLKLSVHQFQLNVITEIDFSQVTQPLGREQGRNVTYFHQKVRERSVRNPNERVW